MSDSTAAVPAASGLPVPAAVSTPPPPSLVQADPDDFVAGSELWVRGQRAVCVRFDYPHVHWKWAADLARMGDDDAPEKHRSCSATPHLFSVRAEAKRSAAHHHAADHNHEHAAGRTDSDDDEAQSDEAQRRADAFAEQQRQQQLEHDEQQQQQQHDDDEQSSSSAVDSVSPASDAVSSVSARLSLMSMFSQRPQKTIVGNLRDGGDETISIAAPQSASIEKCVRTRFSVPNKISQLTLLECEDVEVDFRGVISTVELIRCSRCTLRCLAQCPTYTLDDSSDCVIQFPGVQERVMVVSNLNSARTVLLAQPGGGAALPGLSGAAGADESDEKQPADIDTEVRFVIGDNPVEEEDTPAPEPSEPAAVSIAADAEEQSPSDAPASSSAPKQLQTIWKDGAFSTHTLVRQGPLGYFSN